MIKNVGISVNVHQIGWGRLVNYAHYNVKIKENHSKSAINVVVLLVLLGKLVNVNMLLDMYRLMHIVNQSWIMLL
jgi:hypothetical protein